MKTIFCVLLLTAMSTMSIAQNKRSYFEVLPKEVQCTRLSVILSVLKDPDVNEKPIWIGKLDDDSNISLFINSKTKAWTVIQYQQEFACILGMGSYSEVVIPNSKLLKNSP
jgi:hypothetical protein